VWKTPHFRAVSSYNRRDSTLAYIFTRKCPLPLSRYAKDQQIEISKLKAIIQRLGGMMLSAKRENTDEWMQHLVEMTNQACEDIGDDSRFLYNEGLGVICHKGSRDDKPAKEENTRAITRDSIERESRLRQR
jgi:hypothetical protein